MRGLSAPPLSLSFFIHGKPACSLLARVALLRSVLIRLRFFTLVFSRLRPRRALPRIYVASPAFIGCRAYVSALTCPKVFALFSGKVFAAPRFAVFGFGYSLAFAPRALPLVFRGAPALPLRSRTEVGRTRLCGLLARLKVICYTFDRKNKFPTVLTAKDPPPSNL